MKRYEHELFTVASKELEVREELALREKEGWELCSSTLDETDDWFTLFMKRQLPTEYETREEGVNRREAGELINRRMGEGWDIQHVYHPNIGNDTILYMRRVIK